MDIAERQSGPLLMRQVRKQRKQIRQCRVQLDPLPLAGCMIDLPPSTLARATGVAQSGAGGHTM